METLPPNDDDDDAGSSSTPSAYDRICLLSQVILDDEEGMKELFAQHNTGNGNPERTRGIIEDSINGFSKGGPKLVLKAEKLEGFALDDPIVKIVGTGAIIVRSVHDLNNDKKDWEGVPMYKEVSNGLELSWLKTDCVEVAGMIVDKDHRGGVIGKAITTVRALLIRMFERLLGPADVISEFLPPLEKGPDGIFLGNDFWREAIFSYIKNGNKLDDLLAYCRAELSDQTILPSAESLYDALMRQFNAEQQSFVIKQFFPPTIAQSIIANQRVRVVLENFGGETKGAYINLARVYPNFTRIGYYPIDGGQNFIGSAQTGALGDQTVDLEILDTDASLDILTNEGSQSAVVMLPCSDSKADLQKFKAVVTPGVYSPKIAKLPHQAAKLLGLDCDTKEISYCLLAAKSSKKVSVPPLI